jgi:hypothetical protein
MLGVASGVALAVAGGVGEWEALDEASAD